MTRDYFGIFAGGGVRGTAYIGILKALKELNINLSGIAGSSVGALIASLVATEHDYEEIQKLLYKINYQLFKDVYIPLGKDFGFFKGDEVYTWLKKNIEKKYYGTEYCNNCHPVTFQDIKTELVIIATDVTNSKFKEYSRIKTPDTEIAHAVRASISLPGFFKPVWENDRCLVDGDVINNFPLWKATSDLISNTNAKILEFRLDGTGGPREIENFFDYFNAILDTNYGIATKIIQKDLGKNDQFEIIKIDTGEVKIVDFNITNDKKDILVEKGYSSVKKYFEYDFVEKKQKLEQIYKKIKRELKELKKHVAHNNPVAGATSIASLSILLAENKEYIHKQIYKGYIEVQSNFQKNLLTVKLINLSFLRDKKALIAKIDKVLADISSIQG